KGYALYLVMAASPGKQETFLLSHHLSTHYWEAAKELQDEYMPRWSGH
ncbi:unnamed protein product, partial [marine sediment metagenome]